MSGKCDPEIFSKGKPVALLDGRSEPVEKWVQEVARQSGSRVDWHYSGGVAQVLHLGDIKSRHRVEKVILHMPKTAGVRIMRLLTSKDPGLYRKGVTEAPEGAVVGFMDPLSGKQVYIK